MDESAIEVHKNSKRRRSVVLTNLIVNEDNLEKEFLKIRKGIIFQVSYVTPDVKIKSTFLAVKKIRNKQQWEVIVLNKKFLLFILKTPMISIPFTKKVTLSLDNVKRTRLPTIEIIC
ncbi:MAG: hypothetical protein WDK96_03310 [Candidatus Paceibacterota bacterium]|jgi:hypothetical protein